MATFLSTVPVDMTNFHLQTAGATRVPLIGIGSAAYENSLTMTAFNLVGVTLSSTPMSVTGTVESIYAYPSPASPQPVAPAGTVVSLTGLSVDSAVAEAFLTATSQATSLAFLSSVLSGDDTISGSNYNDTLFGGAGADSISGGLLGTDTVTYFNSTAGVFVSLETGLGARGDAEGDSLSGIENLVGSDYADRLVGDAGANVLNGGAGNDVLIGGGGGDTLNGGDGVDTASYATAGNSVSVDLADSSQNQMLALGDVLTGIENITGSLYTDFLYGDGGNNRIQGLDGDDFLYGRLGNDTLMGGAGDDTISGDDGDDSLQGGDGVDDLAGGEGNDRLNGGAGADTMTGGAGNDSYTVDDFRDLVIEAADSGTDRVTSSAFFYTLTDNVEVLILASGAAVGSGNALDNTVKGNASGNELYGMAGVDTLKGMEGNDTLVGGAGNDRLYGGAGNDRFVFNGPSDGVDRIADWEDGDSIVLNVGAFGLDGITVVSGTDASSLTTDGVFYNTSTGRVYAYDADADTLTYFAVIANKPAALDAGDISAMLIG
ncbi:calcium-binding protein [Zavarzinia aquatilis]|nr:calcium-binding protein [Zavarzinia aquatilis]